MNKLILTIGLPRSGKSTWSRKQGYPIVNRDAIRLALHGQPYIQEAEPMVTAIERYMVMSLFLAGNETVIIDATNLKAKYRDIWITLFDEIDIEYESFNTSKEICIQRAIADGKEHLIPIIERMNEEREYNV